VLCGQEKQLTSAESSKLQKILNEFLLLWTLPHHRTKEVTKTESLLSDSPETLTDTPEGTS